MGEPRGGDPGVAVRSYTEFDKNKNYLSRECPDGVRVFDGVQLYSRFFLTVFIGDYYGITVFNRPAECKT